MYMIWSQFRLSPRSKRGFFSDALSHLTGLATRSQVSDLSNVLRKLEQGIMTAADACKTGSQHYVAAFHVEKLRVDNTFEVIRMQRQSIAEVQRHLAAELRLEAYRANLTMTTLNYVTSTIFQLSQIDNLYSSLQLFEAGQLPHFFVASFRGATFFSLYE